MYVLYIHCAQNSSPLLNVAQTKFYAHTDSKILEGTLVVGLYLGNSGPDHAQHGLMLHHCAQCASIQRLSSILDKDLIGSNNFFGAVSIDPHDISRQKSQS